MRQVYIPRWEGVMIALHLHSFFVWKCEQFSLESKTVLWNTNALFLAYALGLWRFSSYISWDHSTHVHSAVQHEACGEAPQCEVQQYGPLAPSTTLLLSDVPADVAILILKGQSSHKQHRLPETRCRIKLTAAASALSWAHCKTCVLTWPTFNERKVGSKQ